MQGDSIDDLSNSSDDVPDFIVTANRNGQMSIYSEEILDKGAYVF